MLSEHSAVGSANTQLGVQKERPSLYHLIEEMKDVAIPTLVITGDEDWPCLLPGILMKQTISSAALVVIPNSGHVINIASMAAFQPLPGSAVYAASKSFVLSFSEAIRTELRGSGVAVTAVCPGPVRTEFTEVAGFEEGVEDRTPSIVWMSAEEVARHAVDGAANDRRVVVPGVLNRATALAGQHSPRAVALPLISRIWRNV